ncbi:MAG: histidine phosphatase family protein [Pseudomonadota bacterium]
MARLMLLRHAKADWAEPGQRDFDRVLAADGIEECKSIGQLMLDHNLAPPNVICSEAVRATQTLEHVRTVAQWDTTISFERDLYATDAPGYLEIAATSGATGDIMLIGHNPMMEDLAYGLSHEGDAEAMDALNMGFRTCGLAVIRFDGEIKDAASQSGYLEKYLTP